MVDACPEPFRTAPSRPESRPSCAEPFEAAAAADSLPLHPSIRRPARRPSRARARWVGAFAALRAKWDDLGIRLQPVTTNIREDWCAEHGQPGQLRGA